MPSARDQRARTYTISEAKSPSGGKEQKVPVANSMHTAKLGQSHTEMLCGANLMSPGHAQLK